MIYYIILFFIRQIDGVSYAYVALLLSSYACSVLCQTRVVSWLWSSARTPALPVSETLCSWFGGFPAVPLPLLHFMLQERNHWKSELRAIPEGLEAEQVRTNSSLCCYTLRLASRVKKLGRARNHCNHVFTWPLCISAHTALFVRTDGWFCILVTA